MREGDGDRRRDCEEQGVCRIKDKGKMGRGTWNLRRAEDGEGRRVGRGQGGST